MPITPVVRPIAPSTAVITIIKGISYLTVVLPTLTGIIQAVIPRIISTLRILLPKILPIAIPVFPLNAALILTAASGALVPIATIVRPIISTMMLAKKPTASEILVP